MMATMAIWVRTTIVVPTATPRWRAGDEKVLGQQRTDSDPGGEARAAEDFVNDDCQGTLLQAVLLMGAEHGSRGGR